MKKARWKFCRQRSTKTAICGVQLKNRRNANDLILMIRLNETIEQSAMANNVHWHNHVLGKEDDDDHVLRRALELEVEGERKKQT